MKPNELVGLSTHQALKGYSVHDFLALKEPTKHIDLYFYLNCMKKNPYVAGDDLTLATLKDFYDAEGHSGRYNLLFPSHDTSKYSIFVSFICRLSRSHTSCAPQHSGSSLITISTSSF